MSDARSTALRLLIKSQENKTYSNIALDEALKRSQLSAQDKKLTAALFYGVTERIITLDRIIAKYSKRPCDKLSGTIRGVLWLGLYQLKFMDGIPDNAAVDECVKLAKKDRNPAATGFVNAVLRSFIRDGKALPEGKNELESLSIEYSCPIWLIEKWLKEYSREQTMSLLQSSVGQPPTTIRVNTTKITPDELVKRLSDEGIKAKKVSLLENCLSISNVASIEATDAFRQGLFHVQDIASQICCEALDAKNASLLLDVCSAPGGKAFTAAQIMKNGSVMAFDLHENRVRLIKSGAERLGLSNVTASVNNAKVYSDDMPKADRILCDVVCSGLGVIRRKPEIKYKSPEEMERLPEIQYDILSTSSRYLKKDGILIYSTCTVSRAENENVVQKFLKNNPDFEAVNVFDDKGGLFRTPFLTLTPKDLNSDGFFIAKLKRVK